MQRIWQILLHKGIIVALATAIPLLSMHAETVADSVGDVRVSLVELSGQPRVYAAYGHVSVRLEYPAGGLDFIASYEMDTSLGEIIKFFLGSVNAGWSVVPTALYMEQWQSRGRSMITHELNLTDSEKRRLWRQLDKGAAEGYVHPYDYMHNMCSTMAIKAVDRALDKGSQLEWNNLRHEVQGTSREAFLYSSRHHRWAGFFWQTFLGIEGDRNATTMENLSPELLLEAIPKANIRSRDGEERPLIVATQEVLPARGDATHVLDSPSPTMFFTVVLLVVIAFTLLEMKYRNRLLRLTGKVVDGVLIAVHLLLSLFFTYYVLFSHLVGSLWSWYVVPFNIIVPWLVALLLWRSHRRMVVGIYTAVVVVFFMLTPFIPQVDLPHQLFLAIFLVRLLKTSFAKTFERAE